MNYTIINDEKVRLESTLTNSKQSYKVDIYKGINLVNTIFVSITKHTEFIDNFKDFKIAFSPLSEEEYIKLKKSINEIKNKSNNEKFKTEYGFDISDILLYGSTKDGIKMLVKYIPHEIRREGHDILSLADKQGISAKGGAPKGDMISHYPCYANPTYVFERQGINIHPDIVSCWNCFLNVIKNPKYGLLIKVSK